MSSSSIFCSQFLFSKLCSHNPFSQLKRSLTFVWHQLKIHDYTNIINHNSTSTSIRGGKHVVQVGSIELRVKIGHFKLVNRISCQVDPYFLNEIFFFLNYKNKSMTTFLERMKKINQRNKLHLMPIVNTLPILTISSMIVLRSTNNIYFKFTPLTISFPQ